MNPGRVARDEEEAYITFLARRRVADCKRQDASEANKKVNVTLPRLAWMEPNGNQ